MKKTTQTLPADDTILAELDAILRQRRDSADAAASYVAQLHSKGLNKILEKIGEEATETLLAARDLQEVTSCDNESHLAKTEALVGEVADLWFHSMVMLSHFNLNTSDVIRELGQRMGVSGIAEKASRSSET